MQSNVTETPPTHTAAQSTIVPAVTSEVRGESAFLASARVLLTHTPQSVVQLLGSCCSDVYDGLFTDVI